VNQAPAVPIVLLIEKGRRTRIRFVQLPPPAAKNRWIVRAIGILEKHLPRLLDYLNRQHVLALLRRQPVTLLRPAVMSEEEARRLLGRWLSGKTHRRLLYLTVGLPVVILSWGAAILPGINVLGYFATVVYYFYLKAYVALLRTHPDRLDLTMGLATGPLPH